jgi:hypothetical protein
MCRNVMKVKAAIVAAPWDAAFDSQPEGSRIRWKSRANAGSPSHPSPRLASVMPSCVAELRVLRPALGELLEARRPHLHDRELREHEEAVEQHQQQRDEGEPDFPGHGPRKRVQGGAPARLRGRSPPGRDSKSGSDPT